MATFRGGLLILFLALPVHAGDPEFTPPQALSKYLWKHGNYVLSPIENLSAGSLLYLDKSRLVPYSGEDCFHGLRMIRLKGSLPPETQLVWKPGRRWPAWQVRLGSTDSDSAATNTSSVSWPVTGRVSIASPVRPAELPDRITATFSAKGERITFDLANLDDPATFSDLGAGCVKALRNDRSYLVVETWTATVRVRFAQESVGISKPLDCEPGDDWRRAADGTYEKEVVLLAARRPKLKTRGDRILALSLGMPLEAADLN